MRIAVRLRKETTLPIKAISASAGVGHFEKRQRPAAPMDEDEQRSDHERGGDMKCENEPYWVDLRQSVMAGFAAAQGIMVNLLNTLSW